MDEGFEAAQWVLGGEEGVAQTGVWVGGRRPCELSPLVPPVECQIVDATMSTRVGEKVCFRVRLVRPWACV